MEKTDKDKYWLLERIQKNNLKVLVNPAMSRYDILNACPIDFITELIDTPRHLSAPEYETPRYANTYHWFFTDIVAGANPDIATDHQTRK